MNFSQLGFGIFALKIFGVLLAVAFMLAAWHYYRQLKRTRFPVSFFEQHFWRWCLAAVLFGRVVALVLDPEIFTRHGWIFAPFAVWDGEIHMHATFIGMIAMMAWDLRRHQVKIWRWLDAGVVSGLIFLLGMDLAAFLTGSVYGTETGLPWGVQYETFGVETLAPVHPIPLYGFVVHFLLLNWASRQDFTKFPIPGKFALLTVIAIFLTDFGLGFLRGGPGVLVAEMRIEQIISAVVVVTTFVFLLRRRS